MKHHKNIVEKQTKGEKKIFCVIPNESATYQTSSMNKH